MIRDQRSLIVSPLTDHREAFRVDGHQVDNLAHGTVASGRVGQTQCFPVDGQRQRRLDLGAHAEHDEEIVVDAQTGGGGKEGFSGFLQSLSLTLLSLNL